MGNMFDYRGLTLVIEPVVDLPFHHKHADRIEYLHSFEEGIPRKGESARTAYVTVPRRKNNTGRKILG